MKDSRHLLTWDLNILTQQGCLPNCQAATFWVVLDLHKLSPLLLYMECEIPSLSPWHLLATPTFLLAVNESWCPYSIQYRAWHIESAQQVLALISLASSSSPSKLLPLHQRRGLHLLRLNLTHVCRWTFTSLVVERRRNTRVRQCSELGLFTSPAFIIVINLVMEHWS